MSSVRSGSGMRSVSRRPSGSKRQSSTLLALAEKSAKLVPRPSQVAPSGKGVPAETWPLDLRNEKEGGKGWDNNMQLRAVAGRKRGDRSGVPHVAAAVDGRIGVEDFAPVADERHADVIIMPPLRREIHHHDAALLRVLAFAQPGEGRVVGVVGHEPFETVVIAVEG